MINPYVINPALGGTEDFTDIKLGHRSQWVGFESAPETSYLTAHGTIGREFTNPGYHHKGEHNSWHGVGGMIYRDKTGPVSRTSYYGQYAYNTPLTSKIRLSTGAFIGFKQLSIDATDLKREDYNDGAIPIGKVSQLRPDLGFGFWMYSKTWFLGVSGFQLLSSPLSTFSVSNALSGVDRVPHLFITGGTRLYINRSWSAIPSFYAKVLSMNSLSVDANVKFDYEDQFFGGLSLRPGDALAFLAGIVINRKVEVSYSYDITLSPIRKGSAGSHEFIVGFRMPHPNNVFCPSKFW